MDIKFYQCDKCGNVITFLKASGMPVSCCGEPMREVLTNTVDGVFEKHVPQINGCGNKITVKIGETAHPMSEEHFIEWILINTKSGMQLKKLKPMDEPKAVFKLCDGDELLAAYAMCNVHGLWLTQA